MGAVLPSYCQTVLEIEKEPGAGGLLGGKFPDWRYPQLLARPERLGSFVVGSPAFICPGRPSGRLCARWPRGGVMADENDTLGVGLGGQLGTSRCDGPRMPGQRSFLAR